MNPQIRRTLIDFAPLVLFFIAYKTGGIYAATIAVIAACVAAVALGFWFERKFAPVPVFTAVVVTVLGGLTLYFKDDTFIKMKPTFVYVLLGGVLIGSEIAKRSIVKKILGTAMALRDEAWRGLAFRFGFFFLILAVLNEAVWRSFSRDVWVNYHVFGAMVLTFVFGIAQAPFLMRNRIDDETPHGP